MECEVILNLYCNIFNEMRTSVMYQSKSTIHFRMVSFVYEYWDHR